jgi:hypothetical protein
MFDPTGDDNSSEWVELYNADLEAVDLTGWNITDNDGNRFSLSGAGILPPDSYLVCYIAQTGSNSSSAVYGSLIEKLTIQPGPAEGLDNYLYSGSTGTNYGSSTDFRIEYGTSEYRPILKFDLSGLANAQISVAKLFLYRYNGHGSHNATVDLYRVTSTWTESGSNWDTYDGTNDWPTNNDGGDYNSTIEDTVKITSGINSWYTWDIIKLTQGWVNGSYTNHGIILLPRSNSKFQLFYSSDYITNPSLRPKLVVDYINTSKKTMLESQDDIAVLNPDDEIIDYVAWGSNPGTDDDAAVAAGQWVDNTFIDTSQFSENETLARDTFATDTDTTSDWENITGLGDPYGVNSTKPTPGTQNYSVIPEFDFLILPILFLAVVILLTRKKNINKILKNQKMAARINNKNDRNGMKHA